MGSYSGACEIVEARDELNSVEQSRGTSRSQSGISREGNGRKSPVLKLGHKDFLEDDINQLFQAISLKSSSMGPGLSSQASTSTSTSTSPMRKNVMKRPITVGMPHSSGIGNSESLSLKQALRELCISKASEMAAMKRLSMWSSCPGISEAGRIKSLYNSVVVETDRSSLPFDKSKGTMFEISLAPEESGSTSSGKTHRQLRVPKVKSSNQSALTSPRLQALKSPNQSAHSSPQVSCQTSEDVAGMQNESFSWPREVETLELRSVNQSAISSPRSGVPKTQTGIGTSLTQNKIGASSRKVGRQVMKSSTQSAQSSPRLAIPQNGVEMQNEVVSASREFGTQALEYPNQKALSSPRFTVPKMQNDTGTATMENEIASASTKVGAQALKFSNKRTDSSPPVGPTTIQNGIENSSVRRDTGNASRKVGTQALKTDMARLTAATSPLTSVFVDNAFKPDINVSISTKATSKGSSSRSGHKGRLRAAGSSVNENRISKVTKNATRLAKPVIRSSSVKKKIKQGTSCTTAPANGGDCILAPSSGQLVCQRCQCALMNVTGDSDTNFPASFTASLGPEVMASNVNPGAHYSDLSSSNCNRSRDDQTKKTPKSRAKGEFSQSSKSSLGDYSTSTSNSEESNASRSSCCNRPHMSKDIRWEAIRRVKMRDGALSLKHFNLLKKLGCGDIGTVYLAELIGSKYLFAIKVMDNEFLARRKKMPRAQTEREILRILDHPFLPTLYAQFTSENLSCLVMEYCPGGDLHVLRQKQPSRSFLEPAARFYVAEVLLALEYLHMLGIIYRDLKPENILVREDGHIMLTDFDLSLRCNVSPTLVKSSSTDVLSVRISGPSAQSSCIEPLCIEPSCQVPCFTPGFLPAAKARKLKADIAAQFGSLPQLVAEPTDARSNSFVGTHEYLAPEIIKGEGHGAAVDWWTFGVLLYELLYGRTPFKGSGNDVTLDNVVMQSLKFPDTPLVSFQARDLISGLLVKEPENRLGSQKGAAEIKQHPFFEGLNWALIRCAIPPELPEFCDFGVPNVASHDKNCRYLELKATGEHLDFELF